MDGEGVNALVMEVDSLRLSCLVCGIGIVRICLLCARQSLCQFGIHTHTPVCLCSGLLPVIDPDYIIAYACVIVYVHACINVCLHARHQSQLLCVILCPARDVRCHPC